MLSPPLGKGRLGGVEPPALYLPAPLLTKEGGQASGEGLYDGIVIRGSQRIKDFIEHPHPITASAPLLPKNRDRLTNALNYLSLRAPEGCVAIRHAVSLRGEA